MKYADKIGARYSMIIGEDEINKGKALLKNMNTKEEIEVSFLDLVNTMKSIL